MSKYRPSPPSDSCCMCQKLDPYLSASIPVSPVLELGRDLGLSFLDPTVWDSGGIFPVVGFGQAQTSCGKIWWKFGCVDSGHGIPALESCGRRTCPKCFPVWLIRASRRLSNRVLSHQAMIEQNFGRRLFVCELTLSPLVSPQNVSELLGRRAELAALLPSLGLTGGFWVEHPYRLSDKRKEKSQNSDMKAWASLHQDAWDSRLELPDAKNYGTDPLRSLSVDDLVWSGDLRPGLHYHIVAYGDFLTFPDAGSPWNLQVKLGSDFLTAGGRWVKRDCLNQSAPGRFDVPMVEIRDNVNRYAAYVLSHASALPGHPSLGWFGNCSSQSFAYEQPKGCRTCSTCGSVNVLHAREIRKMLKDGFVFPFPGASDDTERVRLRAEWQTRYVDDYGVPFAKVESVPPPTDYYALFVSDLDASGVSL
jgi:hypothetical protein